MTITLDNSNVDFSHLQVGDNDWSTGITIDAGYAPWYVKVVDITGSPTPGYVVNTTDPSIHLTDPLLVESIDTSTYDAMGSSLIIWTGTSTGQFTGTLCLRQHLEINDPIGSYNLKFNIEGGSP